MFQQRPNKKSAVAPVLISFVLLAASIVVVLFKQDISDQINYWRFKPSNTVASIAARDELSNYGLFLLYASQAEVDTANTFNSVCDRLENTTSILGCYSNYRIYIYDVSDTTLDGIREVTAAHEMLHAAYARMSDLDKMEINDLLEAEYAKLKDNKEFSDLMNFYARTEPGERANELHSVIGTSAASLDPALERHYAKYFSNRQAVVGFYEKYNGVFKALADRATTISQRLTELSTSITTDSTQYNSDVRALNADIADFNARAAANEFASYYEFNSERNSLTFRVAALDAKKASIDNDIATYNSLLNEYNSIATQSTKLYNSIDSTLVNAPSV